MLDWYSKPQLDVFAMRLSKEADRLRSLKEIEKPSSDNIAMNIAWEIGDQYLVVAQSFSPVDTGLLRKSHRVGQPEFARTNDGITASVIIDIDPDTEENIKWGGYPVDYGAEYHREKLQWFQLATSVMQPVADRIANDMFSVYINDLWNR